MWFTLVFCVASSWVSISLSRSNWIKITRSEIDNPIDLQFCIKIQREKFVYLLSLCHRLSRRDLFTSPYDGGAMTVKEAVWETEAK